ncbi:MAG: SWIM zinc finger family protein [Planctomycetota bacterium]
MSVDVLDLQELETEELESLVDAVLAARDGIDVRIQQRGKRYRKAVGPFSPCADAEGLVGFVVDVQGSQRRPYQVSIGVHRRRRQRVVDAVCSCPFSDGEDDCKHTWAALDRLAGHLDRELSARRPSSAARPRRQPAGKRTRDWEGGLQHLDRFLSEAGLQPTPGSDAPEEPSVRVVWRVNTRGQRLQIDAYEQTRRKQGGYTPGRHLSWERLLRTEALWEQPDVLAVVLAFKHRTYELGMFWGLQRLDPSEILLELAGSPHVVWADQVKQPVTVIRGEVEARLAPREPDLLELALFFADRPLTHLPRRAGQGMVLVAEDRPTNSLTVGYLEPEVLELAQRFEASPPVFPPQAHPELFARLELLERAFRGCPRPPRASPRTPTPGCTSC